MHSPFRSHDYGTFRVISLEGIKPQILRDDEHL
jgi:hypothetical protein